MKPSAKLRRELFAEAIVLDGKKPTDAYQAIWGQTTRESARVGAARLLADATVQAVVKDLREQFKEDAILAYNVLKEVMSDPLTPANVKIIAAKDILSRAGYDPTQKTETTVENKYPELENATSDQLKKILDEVHSTPITGNVV